MSSQKDPRNTDHRITLQAAVELTMRYRNEMPAKLKPEYANADILPLSETFDKTIFEELAGQDGCIAIRSYLGMDENEKVRLIFVGVNDDDEDILGDIFEHGNRCPPICGATSPLNP